jgi:hypothetical protein
MFANQAAFNDPLSRMQALGKNTRPAAAIVSTSGKPLIYPQTGGMLNPQREEIRTGAVLYRFAGAAVKLPEAATGGWWVHKKEFEQICNYAQQKNIAVPMAARMLCCVPPEWSDMGTLIRATAREPLLAYKGLGNNVSQPMKDGLGNVNMTAHNSIAALRLHQLFIPGLSDVAKTTADRVFPGALLVERHWKFTKEEANRGWLYI